MIGLNEYLPRCHKIYKKILCSPSGHGEFETLILENSLPKINHVIAVEPDVKFNNKIIKALNPPDVRKIKVSKFTRWQKSQGE